MKNKFILLFILLTTLVASFSLIKPEVTAINVSEDGNFYYNYNSQLDETYYESVNTSNSSSLRNTLHQVISKNHKKISYDGVRDSFKTTDAYPGQPGKVRCILTGEAYKHYSSLGSAPYDREHIFPKSHGFGSASFKAYSDLHHLFPGNKGVNSGFHNDRDYKDVVNPSKTDTYGNSYNSTDHTFEIRDAAKGDVARAIFYMDIRYEGDGASDNLQLSIVNHETSSTGENYGNGQIGYLDTLIKWMQEDPVDDFERERNDKVYNLQGNRNPFIDHPEYANIIYGSSYEDQELKVRYVAENATFDYVDNKIYQKGEKVTKPTVTPISNDPNLIFEGWYMSPYFTTKFDFDNYTFKDKPITLYAYFMEKTYLPDEAFKMLDTNANLKISYQADGVTNDEAAINKEKIVASTDGGYANAKAHTIYNLDGSDERIPGKLIYNTNLYDITYHTNNVSYIYVGRDKIRLYNNQSGDGSAIVIKAKNGNVITNVSLDINNPNIIITISDDGLEATIKNTTKANKGNLEFKAINITSEHKTSTVYTFTKDFELGFAGIIDKALYDSLKQVDPSASFGLTINNEDFTLEPTNYGTDKLIFSHKVMVNLANLDKVYTSKFYVNLNGTKIYAKEASFSVRSIAETYLDHYLDLDPVNKNIGVLKAIIAYK